MRIFEKMRKKQMACLLHGCDAEIRDCTVCGWNKEEAARRSRLPLIHCRDGLRRKLVGGAKV